MSQSKRFLGRMGKLSPESDSSTLQSPLLIDLLVLLEGGRHAQQPFGGHKPHRSDLLQVFSTCKCIPGVRGYRSVLGCDG